MAEFNAGSIEADLELNKDPFVAGLEAAKKMGDAYEEDPLTKQLKINYDALAKLEAATRAFEEDPITKQLRISGFAEAMLEVNTLDALMRRPETKALHVDITEEVHRAGDIMFGEAAKAANAMASSEAALASIFAAERDAEQRGFTNLIAAINAGNTSIMRGLGIVPVPAGGAGGAGGGGGGVAVVPPGAGGGGGGGFNWGTLLMSLLLGRGGRGTGGIFGVGAGLPAAGSLLALMGLSPENLLMTTLGLGSAIGGGLLGGGVLGLGVGATMGVGMGTDLAGIGQASKDIQAYYQAQNQLNTAIAVYGKNSTEAKTAQAQLNNTLQGFPAVAQPAIVAAANTAQQFHQMFNAATGPAEKIGAQILQQIMQVGEHFLPVIGKFAEQNMAIIQKALQPLFSWLEGPGLKIFTDFERMFQEKLPTAMNVFVNSIELLMKMLDYAAERAAKSNFLEKIAHYIDWLNTDPKGQAKWQGWFDTMFNLWDKLVHIGGDVIHIIHGVFTADAHTGTAILDSLSKMLDGLSKWVNSTRGQAQLHNLFEAHRGEIEQILRLLPPLLSTFGHFILTVEPPMTRFMTMLLSGLNELIRLPLIGPITTWILGFGMLIQHTVGLTKFFDFIRLFASGKIFEEIAKGIRLVGAAFEFLLSPTGLVILAIIALAVAAYEIYKHWGAISKFFEQMWKDIKQWFEDGVKFVEKYWWLLIGIVGGPLAIIVGLVVHFHRQIWDEIRKLWDDVKQSFNQAWHDISVFASRMYGDVEKFFERMYHDVLSWVKRMWDDVKQSFNQAYHDIVVFAERIWHDVYTFFERMWHDVTGFASRIWHDVVSFFDHLWHDTVTKVTNLWNDITGWFAKLPGAIVRALGNLGNLLLQAGKDIMNGLIHGIESIPIAGSIIKHIGGAIHDVTSFLGIGSPSRLMEEQVGKWIPLGIAQGIQKHGGAIQQAFNALPVVGKAGVARPAAAAGGNFSMNVTVNNPVPETGGQSIHRTMQKIKFHGLLPPELWTTQGNQRAAG